MTDSVKVLPNIQDDKIFEKKMCLKQKLYT